MEGSWRVQRTLGGRSRLIFVAFSYLSMRPENWTHNLVVLVQILVGPPFCQHFRIFSDLGRI